MNIRDDAEGGAISSMPSAPAALPRCFRLELAQGAKQLAIADLVPAGELGLQCREECHPLLLKRPGGVDDGEHLQFTEVDWGRPLGKGELAARDVGFQSSSRRMVLIIAALRPSPRSASSNAARVSGFAAC